MNYKNRAFFLNVDSGQKIPMAVITAELNVAHREKKNVFPIRLLLIAGKRGAKSKLPKNEPCSLLFKR